MKQILTLLLFLQPFFYHSQSNDENAPVNIEVQTGHSAYIKTSAISNDGKLVATGSADNSIIIWDATSGKQIRTINHHSKEIRTLQFNHNNELLISTAKDNSIVITEVKTGLLIYKLDFTELEISNAYFSKNSKYFLAISNRQDYIIYSTSNFEKVYTGTKDYGDYNCFNILSPDEKRALIKLDWKSLGCIDIETKDTLFTSLMDKTHQMEFSPNGDYIVASSSKLFSKVFDANNGKELFLLESKPELKCDGCNTKFSISPNNNILFTKSSKNDGALWSTSTGKKITDVPFDEKRPSSIQFTSDSKSVIISFGKEIKVVNLKGNISWKLSNDWLDYFTFNNIENKIILPAKNNTAAVYSLVKKQKVLQLSGLFNSPEFSGLDFEQANYYDKAIINYLSYKSNVSISPNENAFLIGKNDTSAYLIDIHSGKKLKTFNSNKTILTHAYNVDGSLLALAGGSNDISIYNTENYELIGKLKGHQALIFDLAFDKKENQLISGSWDGTMYIWNVAKLKAISRIDLNNVSAYTVKFDPNDIYAVVGDLDKSFNYWEIDTKQKFRQFIGHTNLVSDFEFSPDGSKIASGSWDNKIKIWDAKTGLQLAKTKVSSPIYSICADSSSFLSGDANQNIIIWDWNGNRLKELKGHSAAVTDIQLSKDKTTLVSRSANGEVIVWDYISKKMKYKYFQFGTEEWIALSPEGYFDGSPHSLKMVNYVVGNKAISVDALFDKYYTPSLISRISNNETFETTGQEIDQLMNEKPQISVLLSLTNTRNISPIMDSVYQSKENTIQLYISSDEKNLDEIRVYNNGKLQTNELLQKEISFRGDKNTFTVNLANGLNEIKVIGVKSNVESEPSTINLEYSIKSEEPNLHILSIGVNKYKNPTYNLNYAEKDAQDFTEAIKKGADTLFNEIFFTELLNEHASKSEILTTINTAIDNIQPNDVFIFYYAGHGVMSIDNPDEFYIAAHGLTNFYDSKLLQEEAISAKELIELSSKIKAQKQVFILDACHSGGALNALTTRGAEREKAIATLARTTGTYFLTASEDIQYANESGKLKHGLFTYAILEILQGKHSLANQDGMISINEIKGYIENRVPELSEEIHGTPQYPTSFSFGRDFPLVILK